MGEKFAFEFGEEMTSLVSVWKVAVGESCGCPVSLRVTALQC